MLNLNYSPIVLVEDVPSLTREQWLQWRRKGIGGSEVSIILGISPFKKTKRDLYLDKRGIQGAMTDDADNWVGKEVGHRLESLVAEIYARKTGYKVYPIRKMFQHPLFPFLIADVDFFVQKPNGSRGILECKTGHFHKIGDWSNGRVPRYYEVQGRHYMSVTNLDFAAFAGLFSNSIDDFRDTEVERDLEDEEGTINIVGSFWNNNVLAGVEPPLDESADKALASIARFYGAADKSLPELELAPAFVPQIKQMLEVKEKKAAVEKEARELDAQYRSLFVPIADQLGQKVSAFCESGGERFEITYAPTGRASIRSKEMEVFQVNHPDLYEKYVSVSDNRTIVVKKVAV